MKIPHKLAVHFAALLICSSAFGNDTYLDGGSLQTVTDTWILPEDTALFIGAETSSNRLVVADGGRVVDSSGGRIGYYEESDDNVVIVTGTNSMWSNNGPVRKTFPPFFVTPAVLTIGGEGGDRNQLIISNGGRVESAHDTIVGWSEQSISNSVLVTGSSSLLVTTDQLIIGDSGSFNSLIIENGGQVISSYADVGFYGANNSVLVTGTNSIWNTDFKSLRIGRESSSNRLTIADGGYIESGSGIIGSGGNGNQIYVTGGGSSWEINGGLGIGWEGSNNSITIDDGGYVHALTSYIGGESGSGNQVVVRGSNSVLSIDLDFSIGDFYSAESKLSIREGGRVDSGNVSIGDNYWSHNNDVTVSGANSLWNINGSLITGTYSQSNSLLISEGGVVIADYGCDIGPEGDYNSVLVAGLNSRLELKSGMSVGYQGSYNSLVVTNGGRVLSSQGLIGGGPWLFDAEPGHNNYAIVSGTNSEWVINKTFDDQSGLLTIGDYGVSNSLYIQDGALVQDQDGRIGFALSATDNHVSVSDGGTWSNSRMLSVGYNGSRNSLLVNSGSLVKDQVGYVGYGSGANSNSVGISGVGSIWRNSDGLYIGGSDEEAGGLGNWVEVSDGGVVTTESLKIYAGNQFNLNNGGKLAVSTNFNAAMAGFNWNEGGALEVGGTVTGAGSVIDGGRSLILNGPQAEWHEIDGIIGRDDSSNGLVIENGGSVTLSAVALGFGNSSHENYVTVRGAGSTLLCDSKAAQSYLSEPLPVPPDDRPERGTYTIQEYMKLLAQNPFFWHGGGLYVGRWGSGNRLDVLDGASVSSGTASLGVRAASSNNVVYVSGADSLWNNTGSLYMGGILSPHWIDGGMNNALYVTDGGKVTVGENTENRNYSMISIDPNSLMTVGGNYYQDATSTLRFGVETNAVGAPVTGLLSVDGAAEFEAGAAINYASNVGELKLGQTYTNKLVAAGTLIIDGVTNAQTADLAMLDASGTLVDVEFWADDQGIYALAGRKQLAESAGLTAGTMLANVATEVDRMSQSGNPGAQNLINLFNTLSGSAQSTQLKQQFSQAAPTPMHAQALGGGLVEVKQHMRVLAPQGPGGPLTGDADAQAWMKTYGSWADHEAVGAAAGYDHSVYGTVVGMDWIRGDILMGFGGGYSYSTLSQNAGRSRANNGYGVGYLSLNRGVWFGDMALAIGGGSVKDKANSAFAFQGDYDAGNGSLYLGGGRDIELLDGLLILTPEASMQLGYYYQGSHRETSLSGLSRNVDSYDQFSAQSSLGTTLALRKEIGNVVWQPELRVRWLHEFENDADPLSYTLVGGLGSQYSAALNAPEENIIETGLGLSCILTNDLTLEFDVDWRRGDDYDAYTGSGRIIYRF